MCAVVSAGGSAAPSVYGQTAGRQKTSTGGETPTQRLEILRSRLDTMRRTLNGAIAGLNAKDSSAQESPDDPRTRLRGLEKEVNSLSSEVVDLRNKIERAEKYDSGEIDKLESALADLSERVEAGMRATASARRSAGETAAASGTKKEKKRGIFSKLLGRGGGDDKYAELIGTVEAGRDRTLFEEATHEARKNNYEVARSLYSVIISTYPESPFLPLSKLAIADTFYLEGTSSALIQAAQSYQDWLTFFPTDPLADDVMLKIAEVEMRRIGLPDRDVSSARKAEQRLKVLLQQFPQTSLRPEAEIKLREVQETLAMHDFLVGNQYLDRYFQKKASNPKGAQSRYLDIVKKYPHFSYRDEVLYRLGRTYVEEEEPDEAAKYFQELVKFHPNSKRAENAREQLQTMGVAVPDPDANALKEPPPEHPSFTQGWIIQIVGSSPSTVNKDGVIIAQDDKVRDLIQEAIENGGQLKHNTNTAPIPRVAPARPTIAPTTPATGATAAPANKATGVSVQPTQPGPPASGSNPNTPPQIRQTPAANAPATPPTTTKP